MADDKKTTPPSWSSPEDARQSSKAGKYPNYYSHKTRSGHVFMMDDSDGGEHVTLQHRGGSMIQFLPDGAIQFVAHNGQYNIVFGENRMLVTGAQDIVVQGGGSLSVDGDYKMKVGGKAEFTVDGDFNITAKNMNQTIRGNIDVQAKNKTEKIEGSSTSQSQGALSLMAASGVTIGATEGSVAVGAKKQVGILAGTTFMMKSGGQTSIKSEGPVVVEGTGKSMFSSSGTIVINGDENAYLQGSKLVQLASSQAVLVVPAASVGGSATGKVLPNDPSNDFKHDTAQVPMPEP